MTTTTATARNAKSLAPGASFATKVAAGETLFPLITVVADRAVRADQEWFEGDGRGYTREFIAREGEKFCTACNEYHEITAFPTFSVPRADGRTRGDVCREVVRARRTAAKAPKVTSVRVPQWSAEEAAKAMRVARARKAAAASAKVRSAKAAAKRA